MPHSHQPIVRPEWVIGARISASILSIDEIDAVGDREKFSGDNLQVAADIKVASFVAKVDAPRFTSLTQTWRP